jgi:hypothetical protein
MTVRERVVYDKTKVVIKELEEDYYADIEGCDGDELLDIEGGLKALNFLRARLDSYLSGRVDNPRGVSNGEKLD